MKKTGQTLFFSDAGQKVEKGKGCVIISTSISHFRKVKGPAFKKYSLKKKDIGKELRLRLFGRELGIATFLGFGSPAIPESNFRKNLERIRLTKISSGYAIFKSPQYLAVININICGIKPQ